MTNWQSANAQAQYLVNVKDEIPLTKLQHKLKMSMVEIWLVLLFGGFTLEQRGEFYDNEKIWVMGNSSGGSIS